MKERNVCIIDSILDDKVLCVMEDKDFNYADCKCAQALVLSGFPIECCSFYGEYKPPDLKERFLRFIEENDGDREFYEFIEFVMG